MRAADAANRSLFMHAEVGANREGTGALLEWAPRAYWLALRVTGDAALAEDAVQEAFVRLLRHPPPSPDARPARVYFLRTVHNAALSLLSSERARERREEVLAVERDLRRSNASPGPEQRETGRAARAALGALPPDLRVAVSLCCEQGLTQREAAEITGVPMGTMARRVQRGLKKLKNALAAAGFASLAPALLTGALAGPGVPAVPAGLAGKLGGLVSVGKLGTVGAAGSAVAKGGIAMKIVAGIVAASVIAGAVAVSTGLGGRGAAPFPEIKPAPINPVAGRETREDVFEFTQKPAVKKEGDKYVITFASKGKCDATIVAVAPDGRVVAHIGSGVLGKNAPFPFQQNSLSQKIEWDGTDDTGKPVPAGCKIKVRLGLKASYERSIAWDPHNVATSRPQIKVKHATLANGSTVLSTDKQLVLFDKTGKYVRTLAPHPANLPKEKLSGLVFLKTTDGDEIPIPPGARGWRSAFHVLEGRKGSPMSVDPAANRVIYSVTTGRRKSGLKHYAIGTDGSFVLADKPGPKPFTEGAGKLPGARVAPESSYDSDNPRLAVDPVRDEVYVSWGVGNPALNRNGLHRYDGKTGKLDKTWPNIGAEEFDVGPDGHVYVRIGYLGMYIVRLDHSGKVVPFEKGVEFPGASGFKGTVKGLYAGQHRSGGNIHAKGFDISVNGDIYVDVQYLSKIWVKARFKDDGTEIPMSHTEVSKRIKEFTTGGPRHSGRATLFPQVGSGHAIVVFGPDGTEKSLNALPGSPNSHGLRADRWGNLYKTLRALPAGQKVADGLAPGQKLALGASAGSTPMIPSGSLIKFPGGPFPVGRFSKTGEGIKFGKKTVAQKAAWAYGGISPSGGSACSCTHVRFDVDGHGRAFVPAAYLYSVMVLDGNGNKILRVGRYGNSDSQGPECAVPEPEIGFAWVRAVAASDTALYALDYSNRRILKAKLSYHAEETVGLDGGASVSTPTPTAAAPVAPKTPAASAATPPTAAPAPSPSAGRSPEQVCRGWWSLAMSYKRAGRADKARDYFDRIVKEHPETEYAARARKEIARL